MNIFPKDKILKPCNFLRIIPKIITSNKMSCSHHNFLLKD